MRSKRSTPNSSSGFTILEFLVAAGVGLIVIAIGLGTILSNQRLLKRDLVRTRVNQNLRVGLEIMGSTIREAGENLPPNFPAVEIIDGGAGAPDELVLRRNLLDDVLKICTGIVSGTTNSDIFLADGSTTQGCAYIDNQSNYAAWQAYRTQEGGNVEAYAYDANTQSGEFFEYVSETDTGTQLFITRSPGTWANDYPVVAGSAVYVIEEWHLRLTGDTIEIIENNDTANPLNLVAGITDFTAEIRLSDGTVVSSFGPGDDWTDIAAVEISLTGEESVEGTVISNTLIDEYFPRNILSN